MKKTFNVLGIIAIVAVIGFSLAACGDGGGGGETNSVNGTYKAADGEQFTLNNGSFEISYNNKTYAKGTYTTSARSISVNIALAVKELHGDILNENLTDTDMDITFGSNWYNKTQVKDEVKKWMKEEYPSLTDPQISDALDNISFDDMFPTTTGTIDGDTMTVDGKTYTKEGGTVPVTPPGGDMTWTIVEDSPFGDSKIIAIAYGNGKFVAGGYDGKMAYSSDGKTWTIITDKPNSSSYGTIYSIAYGNNTWIAGCGTSLARSTDGINWTGVGDIFSAGIMAVTYGGDKFVALGSGNGRNSTSPDGQTWTRGTDIGINCQAVAYGNNTFVAASNDGKMATSSDGKTWTAVTNTTYGTDFSIKAVAFGSNTFVAVGYGVSNKKMAVSSDGKTWTSVENPFSVSTFAIAYGNGKFVAGSNLGDIATSGNGRNWTVVANKILGSTSYSTDSLQVVAYGNGTWVGVGDNGKIAYSTGN